jgi:hypothetical protein
LGLPVPALADGRTSVSVLPVARTSGGFTVAPGFGSRAASPYSLALLGL